MEADRVRHLVRRPAGGGAKTDGGAQADHPKLRSTAARSSASSVAVVVDDAHDVRVEAEVRAAAAVQELDRVEQLRDEAQPARVVQRRRLGRKLRE